MHAHKDQRVQGESAKVRLVGGWFDRVMVVLTCICGSESVPEGKVGCLFSPSCK